MDNVYNSGGRIPREMMNNQEERLTNKHIQTLSFLQEIAQENKAFKLRIEDLEKELEKCAHLHTLAEHSQSRIQEAQEKALQRSDKVTHALADQHREEMMEVLDDKMEMERELKEQILKLRHEVETLQRTNRELRNETETGAERNALKERISELDQTLQDAQSERSQLLEEKERLAGELAAAQAQTSKLHLLQEMRDTNKRLGQQLKETIQKNLEYTHKIDQLTKDLAQAQADREQNQYVEALKDKLEKVVQERDSALRGKNQAMTDLYHSLLNGRSLEERLTVSDMERQRLGIQLGEMGAECERLRRIVTSSEGKAAFKEFVAVKRELIVVKNENDKLKGKVRALSGPLAVLKDEPPHPLSHTPPQSLPPMKNNAKKSKNVLLAIDRNLDS